MNNESNITPRVFNITARISLTGGVMSNKYKGMDSKRLAQTIIITAILLLIIWSSPLVVYIKLGLCVTHVLPTAYIVMEGIYGQDIVRFIKNKAYFRQQAGMYVLAPTIPEKIQDAANTSSDSQKGNVEDKRADENAKDLDVAEPIRKHKEETLLWKIAGIIDPESD